MSEAKNSNESLEDSSDFDKGGRKQTSGLFREGGPYDMLECYNIFLESNDPTCRKFAMQTLIAVPPYERWREFRRLMDNSWFASHIKYWLDELEIKMRSDAIQTIANGCETKDFTRLKWLAEGRASNTPQTGRPSTEEKRHRERMDTDVRRLNPNAHKVLDK